MGLLFSYFIYMACIPRKTGVTYPCCVLHVCEENRWSHWGNIKKERPASQVKTLPQTQSSVVKRATSPVYSNMITTVLVRITELKDNTYYLIFSLSTFFHNSFKFLAMKHKSSGQWDGSASQDTCCQASQPEFNTWKSHGIMRTYSCTFIVVGCRLLPAVEGNLRS